MEHESNERTEALLTEALSTASTKNKEKKTKEHKEAKGNRIISQLVDVKLFGGMVPEEARVVGCYHCDWATSLHPIKVEMVKVSSAFSSNENKAAGSLGRRYIVPYGLYGGSFIYNHKRNEAFAEMTGQGIKLTEMELFEEALKNGSMEGRSGLKGFIEPIMILKVVKDASAGSRYDDLIADIQVTHGETIVSSEDVHLNLSPLKKTLDDLEKTDFQRIELFVSKSGARKHKELKSLQKKYPNDLSVREGDTAVGIEYVVLYEVKRSNPNGDPEMDNMPRRWEGTDTGIISPERQKRWIRDYLEAHGHLIFISRTSRIQKAKDRLKEIADMI